MPRPNPPRALRDEEHLARRLAYERERRGWTYEGLAKRMTDSGCAIHASAVYKIEKGEPRRRVAVNELVALAQVLDLSFDDLLLPPELLAHREAVALVEKMRAASQGVHQALTDFLAVAVKVERLMQSGAADDEQVRTALSAYLDGAGLGDVLEGVPLDDWARLVARDITNAAYDKAREVVAAEEA